LRKLRFSATDAGYPKATFFLSHNYAVTISAEPGAPHLEEIRESGREHTVVILNVTGGGVKSLP
jgi:hypothetical protein